MDGGTGNDIIVYDASDLLVNGGDGIDFLISCDEIPGFETLKGSGSGHPQVSNVEVAIYGEDALDLTSIAKLAEKGITIRSDGNSLTLDGTRWGLQEDGSYKYTGDADTATEAPDFDLTVQIDSSAFNTAQVDEAANLIILTQNS